LPFLSQVRQPERESNAASGYVLVTAAYNEETYIERLLASVVSQTVPPVRWIIVSDGSTDATDEIVASYAARHAFIQLLRLQREHRRNFGAQVYAIQAGCEQLLPVEYAYIGNVDADVSFEKGYFARLISEFEQDPELGLAGGYIHEEEAGAFRSRKRNSVDSVAHAVQLFRRECFDRIGGYMPLKYGGPDWHASVSARMLGWRVSSFPDLPVRHHRPTGTADKWYRDCFRQGRMDFSLGSHPLFEIVKCIRRIPDAPRPLGSLIRLSGFTWSYCTMETRSVSSEFMEFLRQEQMSRVRSLFQFRRLRSSV
jgi:glycosyltransferase involved in cell wall biosynthesis